MVGSHACSIVEHTLECRECFLRDSDPEAALEAFQTAQSENYALKDGAIEAFIAAAGQDADSATPALSPEPMYTIVNVPR